MGIKMLARLIALGMVAAAVVPAGAQSLADVARQEEARRRTARTAGKTYTNDDLTAVPAPSQPAAAGVATGAATGAAAGSTAAPSPSTGPGTIAAASEADKAAASSGKAPAKDQAYWSKRIADLREQLERDSTYAEAMQTRINALTTDFTNRDDPAQRARIGVDRQKAVNELARLKKAIEDDDRAIADLEEEARRAGVPAGWLR